MTNSWMRCCLAGFLVSLSLAPSLRGAGWRNDGTGRFPNTNPPVNWSKDKNVSWKVELPGRSLASPVVVGERVFVTSDPAELICFSVSDGRLLWQKAHEYSDVFGENKGRKIEADLQLAQDVRKQREELHRDFDTANKANDTAKQEQLRAQLDLLDKRYAELTLYPPKPGGDTGNSTSTPVSNGKDIFAVFATGIVSSHSLAGKRNWITYIDGAGGDHSASPLLVDGKLIVHLRDLVTLNPASGKVMWRAKSDELHGSPVAARMGDDSVVVTAGGDVVRTSDGVIIAKGQFRLGHNSPIIHDGVVFSLEDGAIKAMQLPQVVESESKLEVQWETPNARANQLASPVYHDGLLYAVGENGILAVTDAKTGENVYRKRLDFDGGRVDASICLAGEFLFVSNTNGTTLVLRPGRDFEQIARNDFEGFSSSLAFAGDRIYIRTSRFLFCIGK